MTESELIQACLQNDRKGQQLLYESYSSRMLAVCFRYCKEEYLAKEALQNGFIRVFKNLKSFKEGLSLGAWIRSIMINCALDELTKNKRTEHLSENINFQQTDQIIIHEEMTAEVMMSLVDRMPEGYRTIFNMYIIDDLTHFEISKILGIAESTSRSQLVKARNYLKIQLLHKQKLYL